ncbi:unnamed protein product, partial [Ectocarpus sp. 8 AP-2014]
AAELLLAAIGPRSGRLLRVSTLLSTTMCSGREWPTPEARVRRNDAKRRLQEIQELQVASVCLGIEHLMNKRRRCAKGAATRVPPAPLAGQQQARLSRDSSGDARDSSCSGGGDHQHACRLCESTLRVLSTALLHVKRCRHNRKKHLDDDKKSGNIARAPPASSSSSGCDACRMWSAVGDRCASLGIPFPNGGSSSSVLFSTGGGVEGGAGGGRVMGSSRRATTTAATGGADHLDEPVRGRVLFNE